MSFITLEDINGTSFDNQGFWWYELDLGALFPNGEAFSSVKVDFCTISRIKYGNGYTYEVGVDNTLWTGVGYCLSSADASMGIDETTGKILIDFTDYNVRLFLYMGTIPLDMGREVFFLLKDGNSVSLTLKQLSNPYPVTVKEIKPPYTEETYNVNLVKGYNLINITGDAGQYLLVKLLKTDFQFDCNADLTVGKVNTVRLGALSDYKLNGDLVGEYATKLSVLYDGKTLPVVWNESVNDYTFNLDLTNETEEKKIRFKVLVEANDVLNSSETDVVLESSFETINTLQKLTELFRIGGTGRLGANLTLTNDLTISKSVNLIGNDCSINMTSHKLVILSDKTFKAQSVGFSNGINTLQQEPNSTVELTDCNFINCTGFGSVIDCQVDLASLDESDDFNTKLTNCTIRNCDMAILHGGNLEVNGCNVNGKISNKNYPYFLYQTDGNATLLQNTFQLIRDEPIDNDIEFNSCIFVCGETAQVNGYSHSELQANNLQNFLSVQRNTSKIDITYYYPSIDDYIHLQSDNGYCHSVSGVDFVFKTNINLSRGE